MTQSFVDYKMRRSHFKYSPGHATDQEDKSECAPQTALLAGTLTPSQIVALYGAGLGQSWNLGYTQVSSTPLNLMTSPTVPDRTSSGHSNTSDSSTATLAFYQDDPHSPSRLKKLLDVAEETFPTSPITEQGIDLRTKIVKDEDDELEPQPDSKNITQRTMIMPDEVKDAEYWERRRKNNLAAKRSRDARRVKETQNALRVCLLEKENTALKQEVERLQKENAVLREQLNCTTREQYEQFLMMHLVEGARLFYNFVSTTPQAPAE